QAYESREPENIDPGDAAKQTIAGVCADRDRHYENAERRECDAHRVAERFKHIEQRRVLGEAEGHVVGPHRLERARCAIVGSGRGLSDRMGGCGQNLKQAGQTQQPSSWLSRAAHDLTSDAGAISPSARAICRSRPPGRRRLARPTMATTASMNRMRLV